MYKLFYTPGTCSRAVHFALYEIGCEFTAEAVDIHKKETQTAEFKAFNPRGNVPVLVEDGHAIREGGAILVYLLDKEKSALLPQAGLARATALEWLMFANATLHPAYATAFGLKAKGDTGPAMEAILERIKKLWADIDARLAESAYLGGDQPTIGDILTTVIAGWNGAFGKIEIGSNSERMVKEIIALPNFQKTVQAEKTNQKQAA